MGSVSENIVASISLDPAVIDAGDPAKVSNPMIERLMGTVIVEEDTRYSLGTSGAPARADQPSIGRVGVASNVSDTNESRIVGRRPWHSPQ